MSYHSALHALDKLNKFLVSKNIKFFVAVYIHNGDDDQASRFMQINWKFYFVYFFLKNLMRS